MAFKITPKNLGGAVGAVDGLYYMSSPNVVFVCKAGRMFYTVNKALVPEWPTFTDVYNITDSYRHSNMYCPFTETYWRDFDNHVK